MKQLVFYLFFIIASLNSYALTYLQVGVFAQKPNADRVINTLTRNGFSVSIGNERGYTWVFVGPVADRDIKYMKSRLSEYGFKTVYLQRNPKIFKQITDTNYNFINEQEDITNNFYANNQNRAEIITESRRTAQEERDYQEAMKDKRREQEYEDLKRQIEIERMRNELEEIKLSRQEAMRDKEREQKYEDLKREIELEMMRKGLAEEKVMSEARRKQADLFVKDIHEADIKDRYTKTDSIQAENDATRYVAQGIQKNLSKEDKNVYVVQDGYRVIGDGKDNLVAIILASLFGGILLAGGIFWLKQRKNNP